MKNKFLTKTNYAGFCLLIVVAFSIETIFCPLAARGQTKPKKSSSNLLEKLRQHNLAQAEFDSREIQVDSPQEIEAENQNTIENLPETIELKPPKKKVPSPGDIIPEIEIIEIDTPLDKGVKFITPTDKNLIEQGYSNIVIQYPADGDIKLVVNGKEIDPSFIGRTELDTETGLVTETWYGVAFEKGENILTAIPTIDGETQPEVTIKVTVAGLPTGFKIKTVESSIPADGRSLTTIEGQFYDKEGNPGRYNTLVTLYSSGGKFVSEDAKPDLPGFQVEARDGKFTAKLRSDTKPQLVRISAEALDMEAFTQTKFGTTFRSTPLITGFADLRIGTKGTNYYSSFRDFLLKNSSDETEVDFTSGAFATGNLGQWTFTAAYRSDRSLNEDVDGENRLFRSYQPSELDYPLYGDSSQNEIVAPSIDSFYVLLERSSLIENANTDYIKWGDYSTKEFATRSQRYTAFTRQLHGLQGNYNFGDFQISGFFANNVEGFQRDTILPDGTSGTYFLSRRLVARGSEDVFIESEEFLRQGTIVERRRLTRIVDYDIDYDRGTIVFTNPVLRTDLGENGETLVRRIVVTYQYKSHENSDTDIYGGKLTYHLNRSSEKQRSLSGTYIRENKGDRDFELYGIDAIFSFTKNSRAIFEYASSNHSSAIGEFTDGSAYRIELEGNILKGVKGRVHYRSTEEGFANNATASFVPGQTRYGAEVLVKGSPSTNFRLDYDREENFGIAPRPFTGLQEFLSPTEDPILGSAVDSDVSTFSAGIEQKISIAKLNIDWVYRNRTDRKTNIDTTSNQLRSKLSVPIAKKITIRALNETTLSSKTDTVFGDRTLLGLTWEVFPKIKIGLNQQWFTRGQFAGESFTNFSVSGDRDLWTNGNLAARYTLSGAVDGKIIGIGTIGLKQKLNIAEGLRMDFAYERSFNAFGNNNVDRQFSQALAVGQSNSVLGIINGNIYGIGIEYRDKSDFQASAKFEYRDNEKRSDTNINANIAGKITESFTALATFDRFSVANPNLNLNASTKLRAGLAYRNPHSDKFNALLRYEYRQNPSTIPDTILFGSGTGSEDHVFATEAIYAPHWRWEFYGKVALKDTTTFLAEDFTHHSTIALGQLRATYRFAYQWDISGEGRFISQPSANYHENGFSIELGFYPVSDLRFSAGYAFGDANDRDFTGYRSQSGPYFGATLKLNGIFDAFGQPKFTPTKPEAREILKNAPNDSEIIEDSNSADPELENDEDNQ
ncbi:MAG: TonB-dependent receptor [Prochloraceae cyanobacterium]|nr:TonB-dependent receptor [Prochloraceae cyanobacterium]